MRSEPTLVLLEPQFDALRTHLFSGDGLEAAAILICGRAGSTRYRFCVRDLILVPYAECSNRSNVQISWPGRRIEEAIDRAEATGDSVFLIHSHPGGFYGFSEVDNQSDERTITALFQALPDGPHGSATMTPDGAICARLYTRPGARPLRLTTTLVGEDITELSPVGLQPVLAFSDAMRACLSRRTACVIGVSGTGSIVAEILARLGIGRLILIDFDIVEGKNLNRIVNSTADDALAKTLKVTMMAKAIRTYRSDIEIIEIDRPISEPGAIVAASTADVMFCCVDSSEGRLFCDHITQCALVPLIDVGVTIPTRLASEGGRLIADVCGRIDFVRPGGPSLQDRRVVTPEALRREYLLRHAPEEAEDQLKEGYLKGIPDEAPSVISLNMRAASAAVNEWLSRLFKFRLDGNWPYARTLFSLAAMDEDYFPESAFEHSPKPLLGRGLAEPLLGMPSLAELQDEAA
ncbi:MAG: ThiF family adenylyltransferase [Rhizobiaceae bacterium]|nr:ThiF family adenylyltransferase [Rhizobiaceae bacterium]